MANMQADTLRTINIHYTKESKSKYTQHMGKKQLTKQNK
jgi:hypothetical protein